MKKIFILSLFVAFIITAKAQNFQMTIKPGTTTSSIKAVIRPATTLNNAQMSSSQITVMVRSNIGGVRPVAVIKNNPITGMGYLQFLSTETTPDGAFYVYEFDGIGGPTVPNTNYTGGTEYDLLEIQFVNRPDVMTQVRLAQLPNGGLTGESPGNYNYYLAMNGTDVVNQVSQFYGPISSNDGQGYSGYSYAALNGVTLPIKWLNFSTVRKANDAVVSWSVDNDLETEKYVVERSTDGNSFVPVAEVPKRTGAGPRQYEITDANITALGVKSVNYRVKSVDAGNKLSYTEIKTIRLDLKGSIGLFPNPAKDGFNLTIPYLNPNQQRVQLHLVNALGQTIEQRDITRLAAANYYYGFQSAPVPSGDYLLKIYEDGQLMETKRVVVKR